MFVKILPQNRGPRQIAPQVRHRLLQQPGHRFAELSTLPASEVFESRKIRVTFNSHFPLGIAKLPDIVARISRGKPLAPLGNPKRNPRRFTFERQPPADRPNPGYPRLPRAARPAPPLALCRQIQ